MVRSLQNGRYRVLGFARRHCDLLNLSLLVAVALFIRLPFAARPLHGDELKTFVKFVEHVEFLQIFTECWKPNNHILNSLLMKLSLMTFGDAPPTLRLHNLLFGLGSIIFLYKYALRYVGRLAAFIAAFVICIHPATVLYSVWDRGYSGLIFFSILSSFIFLELRTKADPKKLVLHFIVSFLAVLSHLYAVLVLIAEGCVVLTGVLSGDHEVGIGSRLKKIGPIALQIAGLIALAAVVYWPLLAHRFGGNGLRYAFQASFPIALVNYLGGLRYDPDLRLIQTLVLLVALGGFLFAIRDRFLKFFIALLFAAPMMFYFISAVEPLVTLHPRFFIFLLPFYSLCFSAGLEGILTEEISPSSRWIHRVFWVTVLFFVIVFFVSLVQNSRVHFPRPKKIESEQRMRTLLSTYSESSFLTNNQHFLFVKFSHEREVTEISHAASRKEIEAYLKTSEANVIFYVLIPPPKFSARNLIHYKKKIPPAEFRRRFEELEEYLGSVAVSSEDLPGVGTVFTLRDRPNGERD